MRVGELQGARTAGLSRQTFKSITDYQKCTQVILVLEVSQLNFYLNFFALCFAFPEKF